MITKRLTACQLLASMMGMGKFFSTAQAAAKIGVSRQTLYSWIESGLIRAPEPIQAGGASVRLWTQADVDRAAKAKGTLKTGRPSPKSKDGAR
jgi:excisionase family DNA binding protein